MTRGDPKDIIEEAKRYLTGTKNPSNKRFIFTIIIVICIFLAGFFLKLVIENVTETPDVSIQLDPFIDKSSVKEFIPITVTNIKNKEISNGTLDITTCYMTNKNGKHYYQTYTVSSLLIKGSSDTIHFADLNTIQHFKKKDCSEDRDTTEIGSFILNLNETASILNETSSFSGYACGRCYYDGVFTSDTLNKTFAGYFPSPVRLNFLIVRE